jgi:hypothetical protein
VTCAVGHGHIPAGSTTFLGLQTTSRSQQPTSTSAYATAIPRLQHAHRPSLPRSPRHQSAWNSVLQRPLSCVAAYTPARPPARPHESSKLAMANPAVDPKAAPLADDLKELALYVFRLAYNRPSAHVSSSLPTTVFPKAFFCALCSALALDAYKLLCCNKAICTPCESGLI